MAHKDDYFCVLKARGKPIKWTSTLSQLRDQVGLISADETKLIRETRIAREVSGYTNLTILQLCIELKSRGLKASNSWVKGRLIDDLMTDDAHHHHAKNLFNKMANDNRSVHSDDLCPDDLDCSLFDDVKSTASFSSFKTAIDHCADDDIEALRAENKALRDENKDMLKLLFEQQTQIKKLIERLGA